MKPVFEKRIMKRKVSFLTIALFLPMLLSFQSCWKDDSNKYDLIHPNAIVTVKPVGNSFYMQLNDNTTLEAENIANSPYGNKEVRAFINYQDAKQEHATNYSKVVYVNWIDSILTKNTIASKGSTEDIATYGDDPVWLIDDWITVCEDGYLTLHFRTKMGDSNVKHTVSLVTGVNPNNPYEVTLRHDANGDAANYYADGVVAFRLSSLPNTDGKTVILKLNWDSFSGIKSAEFNYCSRGK